MTYKWLGNELVLGKGGDYLGTRRAAAELPCFHWAPRRMPEAERCWCARELLDVVCDSVHCQPKHQGNTHFWTVIEITLSLLGNQYLKRCLCCLARTPAVIQAKGLLWGRCWCLSSTHFSRVAVLPQGRLVSLLPNTLRANKLPWWQELYCCDCPTHIKWSKKVRKRQCCKTKHSL